MSDYYSKELPLIKILTLLRKLKKQGLKKITISGGEPLLRKDLFEILEECPNDISILTNSIPLTPNLLNKFLNFQKRTSKKINFRISLDGLASNKKMRGYSFKDIISRIKIIKKAGFIVVVNTTISPLIKYKELKDMLYIFEKLKVNLWNIDIPFNEGNFKNNNLSINLNKTLKNLKKLIIIYLKKDFKMRLDIIGLFCSERIRKNMGFYECDLRDHPCSYQFHSMTINPEGEILLCPSLHVSFGQMENFKNYRNSKKWKEFASKKRESPIGCKNCRYLKICGGGCRANAFCGEREIWGRDFLSCKLMEFLERELLYHFPLKIQKQFKSLLITKPTIENYLFKKNGDEIKLFLKKVYPKNPQIVKKMSYNEKTRKDHISTKIAMKNNEIIGQSNIFTLDKNRSIANLGYHVHPDFRNQGIGENLSRGVISEAKKQKVKIIIIQTKKSNSSSLALAKKLGFTMPSDDFFKKNNSLFNEKYSKNMIYLYKKIN